MGATPMLCCIEICDHHLMSSGKIIFAGSGEFGLPTVRALLEAGHEIALVVTQPDRPAGRGRTMKATPIGEFAAAEKLPLLKTSDINQENLPPADLMMVIAFGQKIAPAATNHPRLGSINLHASLLPKYRGAAPINWAIIRGEKVTGNSIIRLAQRMDAGAILAQSSMPIGELETAGELHDRLANDGAALTARTVAKIMAGQITESPQDESQATLAPKLSREQSKLDFSRPAVEIANQIRGMYPWPGCRVSIIPPDGSRSDRVTLDRARSHGPTGGKIGIISANGQIATGDGALEIVELQPEGKRPMSLDSYRNGHQWDACRVEPIT